jgi:hypothetical protein
LKSGTARLFVGAQSLSAAMMTLEIATQLLG